MLSACTITITVTVCYDAPDILHHLKAFLGFSLPPHPSAPAPLLGAQLPDPLAVPLPEIPGSTTGLYSVFVSTFIIVAYF